MFSINKNSYLHSYYKDVNPALINRSVQKAFEYINIDEHDLDPPFQRLTSEQPSIPVKNIDLTRRPLGFGKAAMPKLRRELHHKNIEVVQAALESICDLIHNPERGYEAVNLHIVERLLDLALHETPAIREKTGRTLALIARLSFGKEAIVANQTLLSNIAQCTDDDFAEVRIQFAALMETLSSFWKAADELVNYGFITILLNNLEEERDEIIEIHLKTIASLLYGSKGKTLAMDNDGFNIFITTLLQNENEKIISGALKCLALLASTCRGEKIARQANLLNVVKRFLFDECPEIHTAAAEVIMYCTVKTKGKAGANEIKPLTKRLIQLCRNKQNPSTQIFAIKALTNICEHPEIRKDVRKKYYEYIEKIQVGGDVCIKEYKNILMRVIDWVSASST